MSIIKKFIPPILLEIVRKVLPSSFYRFGFKGNYTTFAEAQKNCFTSNGYQNKGIIDHMVHTAELIKANASNYLNDRNAQLISAIGIALLNNEKKNISILDIGGWVGIHYLEIRKYFSKIEKMNWFVLETEAMTLVGKENFATEELQFFDNIDSIAQKKFDIIIASGSIQYFENPFDFLLKLFKYAYSSYFIISRLPLIDSPTNRILIQNTPIKSKNHYLSFPLWFFSEKLFLNFLEKQNIKTLMRWETKADSALLDKKLITFQGMLLFHEENVVE